LVLLLVLSLMGVVSLLLNSQAKLLPLLLLLLLLRFVSMAPTFIPITMPTAMAVMALKLVVPQNIITIIIITIIEDLYDTVQM
jgi:hypothetical protein